MKTNIFILSGGAHLLMKQHTVHVVFSGIKRFNEMQFGGISTPLIVRLTVVDGLQMHMC